MHDATGVQDDLGAASAAGQRGARQQVAAGEADDEGVRRAGDELGSGADLPQPPVDDDPDPVGERDGVAEVVGDDERRQRELPEQVLQLDAHRGPRVGVQRRQRLVEQQHGRIAGERPGERDALALAAGERRGLLARQPGDAEALEQLVDAGGAAERDVRAHAEVRKQRVLLKDEPDRALLGREVDLRRGVEPRALAQRDAAPVRAAQTCDCAQDRRLARTRGADERDGLRADGQLDVELERAQGADDG